MTPIMVQIATRGIELNMAKNMMVMPIRLSSPDDDAHLSTMIDNDNGITGICYALPQIVEVRSSLAPLEQGGLVLHLRH